MCSLEKVIIVAALEAENLLDSVHREHWVHPFNELQRENGEKFKKFFTEIKNYPDKFFEYFRMSVSSFEELLELVRTEITKKNTFMRDAISAEERLTITIR